MKKKKGITLIALIITIIVLLILAGVSISIMVGDNGVLNQAQISLEKTNLETAKEEISMAWANCQAEYLESLTTNANSSKSEYFKTAKMNDYLTGKGKVDEFTYGSGANGETIIVYTKANNSNEVYNFNVSPSGEIKLIAESSVSTGDSEADLIVAEIAGDSSKVQEYYGHIVTYNGDSDWEILYVGSDFKASSTDNRIYLISKTARKTEFSLSGKEGTALGVISDANDLCAWWKAYGATATNTNTNAKAVAYLLNNANWSDSSKEGDFLDENVAEWVIGGPTEDIFLESYNQYYGLTGDNAFKYTRNNTGNTDKDSTSPGAYDFNAIGYYFDRSSGTKNPSINGTFASGTVYNRDYFFWFASPGTNTDRSVRLYSHLDASLGNVIEMMGNDIRPLVCLKSTAQITKEGSSWTIMP